MCRTKYSINGFFYALKINNAILDNPTGEKNFHIQNYYCHRFLQLYFFVQFCNFFSLLKIYITYFFKKCLEVMLASDVIRVMIRQVKNVLIWFSHNFYKMRGCSGQDAGSLRQRSRVQSSAWAEFIFCSSAHFLGSLSPPSLRGRLNEYQSLTGKVTAGCGRMSGLPLTTLELAPLSAQNHLEINFCFYEK